MVQGEARLKLFGLLPFLRCYLVRETNNHDEYPLRHRSGLERTHRRPRPDGCRSSTAGLPRTSTSTTLPARRHFVTWRRLSSAFFPTIRACTGAPASSRASAPLRTTRRTTSSRSFVGADTRTNTVIFGKNTTEAINKLAFRYPLTPGSVVLSTEMEHHSNDLPWRRATVVRARVTPDGRLDEDDVDRLFAAYGERIALVTVSGASNVTGFVQPIHRLARKAHRVGASILVDAAQLAPHRRIDMKPDDDPEHIDFVALSAHKMYAPFGTGALVGRREIFLRGAPEYQGGGTVEIVTPGEVHWAGLPDRDEAGSPNVIGAVAMAVAARTLMDAGMEDLERHEASLTQYALERLRSLPGVVIYGESDPARGGDRVGVIPFNVVSTHHALVAAILGSEAGIGVRSGCFCAQSYVARLLRMTQEEQAARRGEHLAGDRRRAPGMVRASLGAYNTFEEIDALIEMVGRITRHDYHGEYCQVPETGDYRAAGAEDQVLDVRSLMGRAIEKGDQRRYAISGVSVIGLRIVERNTALVTKSGDASNSSARIVVATATGIDESTTTAWRAGPDTLNSDARPSATSGATSNDTHDRSGDKRRSFRCCGALELHAKNEDHQGKRRVAQHRDWPQQRRRHRDPRCEHEHRRGDTVNRGYLQHACESTAHAPSACGGEEGADGVGQHRSRQEKHGSIRQRLVPERERHHRQPVIPAVREHDHKEERARFGTAEAQRQRQQCADHRHDEHDKRGEQHHQAELPSGCDRGDQRAKSKARQQRIEDDVGQRGGTRLEPPGEGEACAGDHEDGQEIRRENGE